jgi:hypothetical protein
MDEVATQDWRAVERLVTLSVVPAARLLADHADPGAQSHAVTALLQALASAGVRVSVADWGGLADVLGGACASDVRVIVSVTNRRASNDRS